MGCLLLPQSLWSPEPPSSLGRGRDGSQNGSCPSSEAANEGEGRGRDAERRRRLLGSPSSLALTGARGAPWGGRRPMGAGGVRAPTRGRGGTEELRAVPARPGSAAPAGCGKESEREVGFSGQVDALDLCGKRVRVGRGQGSLAAGQSRCLGLGFKQRLAFVPMAPVRGRQGCWVTSLATLDCVAGLRGHRGVAAGKQAAASKMASVFLFSGSLRPSSLTPAPPALPLPPFAADGGGALARPACSGRSAAAPSLQALDPAGPAGGETWRPHALRPPSLPGVAEPQRSQLAGRHGGLLLRLGSLRHSTAG